MRSWNSAELDVQPREPAVLASDDEGRAIVLQLPAGERLGEHQVHERAWLMVVSGRVQISEPGGEPVEGGPGLLAVFEPNARHQVAALEDARLVLVLTPWPGAGHPSAATSAANPG